MATIKERKTILNVNYYPRFYEFNPKDCCICSECPANTGDDKWKEVAAINLGVAVHTNWKLNNNAINIVYICESPSNKETSYALPSVGRTGKGIYKNEIGTPVVDYWLDDLDSKIYRTNIVRCQADAGLQTQVDTTRKNQRVKAAFDNYCSQHLRNELNKIFNNCTTGSIRLVLAIGGDFPRQIKKTEAMINRLVAPL
jgi:hypothetical protein